MMGFWPATLADRAQDVIEQGSKSFAAACRLFPPELRDDVMLLYAWCRYCDDLTDGQELGRGRISTASQDAVSKLRQRSLAALAGQPENNLPFLALAEIAERHPISSVVVNDHIRGFELDVEGWLPETFEDTVQYCYHSAGSVGIMMAKLMDVHDAPTLHRASDLGIAFQLINIARDVSEDALAGRSYVPRDWRLEADLTIADLADPAKQERVYPLVLRLIEAAEPYFQSAALGVRALPRRAAWAVATARTIYRDIGQCIIATGPEALGERTYTSKISKAWSMATALPEAAAPRFARSKAARTGLWTPPTIV